jgi:adenylosuccinate lyase
LEDDEIKEYLTEEALEEIFNIDYHLKYVEDIFERVFT